MLAEYLLKISVDPFIFFNIECAEAKDGLHQGVVVITEPFLK
jgi:hypothetical protein